MNVLRYSAQFRIVQRYVKFSLREIGRSSLQSAGIWLHQTNCSLHGKLSSLRPSFSLLAIFGSEFYIVKRWISLLKVIKRKRGSRGKVLLCQSRRRAFLCFNSKWLCLPVFCLSYYGVYIHCVFKLKGFKEEGTWGNKKCKNTCCLRDDWQNREWKGFTEAEALPYQTPLSTDIKARCVHVYIRTESSKTCSQVYLHPDEV